MALPAPSGQGHRRVLSPAVDRAVVRGTVVVPLIRLVRFGFPAVDRARGTRIVAGSRVCRCARAAVDRACGALALRTGPLLVVRWLLTGSLFIPHAYSFPPDPGNAEKPR